MGSDTSLVDQVAVVTGALGRLGSVWVSALASKGCTVVGVDVRSDGATDLTAVASSMGGEFRFMKADVSQRRELESVLATVTDELRPPVILVNNAGIDAPPSTEASTFHPEDFPLQHFLATMEVNVAGTFVATQVFGGAMVRQRRGSIINIGSLYASVAPDPTFYDHLDLEPPFLKPPAYGASKAGVIALTRYFARVWGPHGVRVNSLSPGGVKAAQDEVFVEKYSARVPLGRMAEPDDLVGPLLFLASDASRYVTGHNLQVDGGFTA